MGSHTASTTALVTGGGGFLGGAIVKRLLARGERVHTFQRNSYPELAESGATNHQGDLTDLGAVDRAMRGCDVVFHAAAKVGVWGRYRDFFAANVEGTRHVIEACRRNRVRRLVYSSSPSVVFDGRGGHGIDESAPYPKRYLSPYPKTKALAERLVLAANDDELATVSLRPHLIWGPGDRHLVPRIVHRARTGKLRLVGTGENLVDVVYIDNAVEAHILAADALAPEAACAGRAYFISNGEPRRLGELINQILAAACVPPVRRSISPHLAYVVGAILETVHAAFRIEAEPLITRFMVRELATSHWFDLTAARRDLGYEPAISIDEGLRRLERALSGNSAGNQLDPAKSPQIRCAGPLATSHRESSE
jgi:nucleoside-diphosphate-sugar epimerase